MPCKCRRSGKQSRAGANSMLRSHPVVGRISSPLFRERERGAGTGTGIGRESEPERKCRKKSRLPLSVIIPRGFERVRIIARAGRMHVRALHSTLAFSRRSHLSHNQDPHGPTGALLCGAPPPPHPSCPTPQPAARPPCRVRPVCGGGGAGRSGKEAGLQRGRQRRLCGPPAHAPAPEPGGGGIGVVGVTVCTDSCPCPMHPHPTDPTPPRRACWEGVRELTPTLLRKKKWTCGRWCLTPTPPVIPTSSTNC